ncbi:MAG: hypothetical protein RL327_68, partial [Pseudomonadota bacterium]
DDKPPKNVKLEDGVYYNKYMPGNKIKMAKPLNKDSVNYSDGTVATQEQLAKDVTVIYLLILTVLVYLVKKKIWSRVEPKV